MNESMLPGKVPEGAQLALGVQGAAMYMPNQKSDDRRSKWLGHYDDKFVFDFSKLYIVKEAEVLGHLHPQDVPETDEDNESNNSGINFDEDDDETYERWRNLLLMKLDWNPVTPELPINFQPIKQVEYENDGMYDIRETNETTRGDYIPGNLISSISVTENLHQSPSGLKEKQCETIFDPTVGDQFTIGSIQTPADLRNSVDQHYIMAWCSGKTKSALTLAVLKDKCNSIPQNLEKDDVGESLTIDLRAKIKSIKFPSLAGLLGRSSDRFAVVSENALHIIKIDNVDSHSLRIFATLLEPLPFAALGDFPFADMAFSPWDLQQFAVVDIRGNFGIGRMPKNGKHGNRIRLSKELTGSIFDPEELSSWKRIEWSSTHDRLLIMDRSKIIEVNFEQDWQIEIVQAKTWSTLRDYRRVDDDFGVLLTSKEIILIKTMSDDYHIRKQLSWKHDLDSGDPTLRLIVQKLQGDDKFFFITCVFSNCHNNVYVHGFSIDKNGLLVRATRTPSILEISSLCKGPFDICFATNEERFLVHNSERESSTDQALHVLINERKSGKFFHTIITDLERDQTNLKKHVHFDEFDHLNQPSREQENEWFSYKLENMLSIVSDIMEDVSRSNTLPEISSDEILQEYGYDLSKAINAIIEVWDNDSSPAIVKQACLENLQKLPIKFGNMEEISSLLEQLLEYYQGQDIAFTKFSTISKLLLHEEVPNLEIFYNKMLQCWDLATSNANFITKEVTKSLLWCVIRLWKPSRYEEINSQLENSLTEPYAEIFGDWENNDEVDESFANASTLPFGTSSQFPMSSQSQIPTIKSSQSRTSRQTRRGLNVMDSRMMSSSKNSMVSRKRTEQFSSQPAPPTLPNNMTPAFTLMQPSSMVNSQSQSSQRTKRRKKRVGGFG